ncbi:NAD(P)-binding protein [Venturia nashicola]|uniref:NAD(P)-binding protein n=1 Tax=Venturia nashicola TaxID=86259 RepID=A0A4Z1NXW8_9PEZI|nr:NAD(P)-binding protein [Venturia nashicola]
MPSYLITGASRGLGYAFLKTLSQNPTNEIIALVRNKPTTLARLKKENHSQKNIHILQADILDPTTLQTALPQISKITGGSLDVLINNAAYISEESNFTTLVQAETDLPAVIDDFSKSIQTNLVGVFNTVTVFLPLLRLSPIKKVISLTTGMADLDFTLNFSIPTAPAYSISKAALNMLVVKYHNAYKEEGILFMGISPGLVATAENKTYTSEELEGFKQMITSFQEYAPNFEGPISPQQSVDMVLKVIEEATVEKSGGSFVSHYGNKQWL